MRRGAPAMVLEDTEPTTVTLSPQPRLWQSVVGAIVLHGALVAGAILLAWPAVQPAPKALETEAAAVVVSFAAPAPVETRTQDTEMIIPVELASAAALPLADPVQEELAPRSPPEPIPEPTPDAIPEPIKKAAPPKPVQKQPRPVLPRVDLRSPQGDTPPLEAPAQPALAVASAVSSAPQTIAQGPSPAEHARWQAELLAHLNRYKTYPRQARLLKEQGVVAIRAVIAGDGSVLSAALDTSSGSQSLDAEALALLERARPLPLPPVPTKADSVAVVLPLRFSLR